MPAYSSSSSSESESDSEDEAKRSAAFLERARKEMTEFKTLKAIAYSGANDYEED